MKRFIIDRTKLLIISSLIGGLIITILIEVLSYNSNKQLSKNNNDLFNYYKVLEIQHDLLTDFFILEGNGHRFLITGDEKFLQKFEQIEFHVRNSEKQLSNYFKEDNDLNQVNQLNQILNMKLSYIKDMINLYKQDNLITAQKIMLSGKGRQLNADFFSLTDKINDDTQKKIQILRSSNFELSNNTNYWDKLTTVVAILVLALSMFLLFKNLKQRNLMEIDLRKEKNKAEQSAILKEQFMANMSHEIRTPMTAIIGFINLLERTHLNNIQKDYLHTVKNSSENLLNIINDILDFSKLEAGMIRFEQSQFNVQSLLHSVYSMLLPKTKEKNIRLFVEPVENIPENLIGDPTRLTQIMINIIGNAIKFTNQGIIMVSIKLLKEDEQFVTLQFNVSDTGIGIPENKIGIIFDRFQQADADTNRHFGGTGLGLSIAKDLVEFQGGVISVESIEGKGSHFTFSIPYKKVTASNVKQIMTEENYVPKKIDKKIRILVAEDNPMNRKLIDAFLTEWGYEYEIAENGKEAIGKISSGNFGLVLMDIQMPEINGYEATKFIRENLKSTIPIIAMTAHVLVGEQEKCILAGMTDYISKPINENKLYSLIVKYAGDGESFQENENTILVHNSDDTGRVTNLKFLTSLANGKKEFFNEMIRIFLEENPKEISQLKKAIEEKNFQMIHANSHSMKSTIPFVGLDIKLKLLLEEMEESLDLNRINQLFVTIESVCAKAVNELENYTI